MQKYMCLVICFLMGVLIFYFLNKSCGCNSIVEGNGDPPHAPPPCTILTVAQDGVKGCSGVVHPVNCVLYHQENADGTKSNCLWNNICEPASQTCMQHPSPPPPPPPSPPPPAPPTAPPPQAVVSQGCCMEM